MSRKHTNTPNKIHFAHFQQVEQLWDQLLALSNSARPTQEDLDGDQYDPAERVSEWLARGKGKKTTR